MKNSFLILSAILFMFMGIGCATSPDPQILEQALTRYPPEKPYENSGFFPFEDGSIHFRSWETGKEDTGILLVHGLGASTFSWRYTAGDLAAAGYLVIAVDLPAFGYSSRNPGAGWNDQTRSRALWSLLTTKYPAISQWILIGHSYGGRITLGMAAHAPNLDVRWIGIAPAIAGGGPRTGILRFWPFKQIARTFIGSRFQKQDGVAGTLEGAYGREPREYEILGYLAPFLQDGAVDGFIEFTLVQNPQRRTDTRGTVLSSTSLELVSELQSPGLLIWGDRDEWVPPEQAESLLELGDFDLRIIRDAGHVPQETHPREVGSILLDWIQSRVK